MSQDRGTLVAALAQVASVLEDLPEALDDDRAVVTLTALGLEDAESVLDDPGFRSARDGVTAAVDALTALAGTLGEPGILDAAQLVTLAADLAHAVQDVVTGVERVGTVLAGFSGEAPAPAELFDAAFALVVVPALGPAPWLLEVLTLLGIVTWTQVPTDEATLEIPSVDWQALVNLVMSPGPNLEQMFEDQGATLAKGLLAALTTSLRRSSVPVLPSLDDPDRVEAIVLDAWPDGPRTLGFEVGVPVELEGGGEVALRDTGWSLSWEVAVEVLGGSTGTWTWGGWPSLTPADDDGRVEASLGLGRGAGPVLSIPGGPAIQADSINVEVTVTMADTAPGQSGDIVTAFGASLTGLRLEATATDGLLAALFDAVAIGPLDVALGWSPSEGISVEGRPGISLDVPMALTIGPVTVTGLAIVVTVTPGLLTIEATGTLEARLGIVDLSVEGLGLELAVGSAVDGGTSIGPGRLRIGAAPPTGIGVATDVGVASGGGFLRIDVEAGRYDGVIDLDVMSVRICAVALIDTRAEGVDGWSMFFALFLDLPSIQLGFGFTLLGVGGLAGINRGVDVDALGSSVRSGALDTVLFPADPIADAPLVIAELSTIFIAAADSYVIGPVVKLGWGTPTLIEARLGVVIQLPDPIVIAVLGSLSAILPTKEADLVALNLDVAGVIDFDAGTLSIDASLHHSHVVGFSLSGDMALRADFKYAQSFLMAVGGFHPAFDPPGDFPALNRLYFGITAGSILRLDFESYFALTSNTVQFGAFFEIEAEVLGFGIEGGAGFDALVQFSPFLIVTSVDFEVTLVAVGVDLAGVMLHASVEGPNRWHVIGTATFKVLGIEKSIRVDEVIGNKETEPAIEVPDLAGELLTALRRDDAWSVLPVSEAGVTLSERGNAVAGELRATPNSMVAVSQRLVPLGVELETYGDAPIGPDRLFDLKPTDPKASGSPVQDWFAPAQFLELSASERLEGPSFEQMKAGIAFGSEDPEGGASRIVDTGYKQYIIDPMLPEELDTPTPFRRRVSSYLDVDVAVPARSWGRSGRYTVEQRHEVNVAPAGWVVLDDRAGEVARTGTWTEARRVAGDRADLHVELALAGAGT